MPVTQETMKNAATRTVITRYMNAPCCTPNTALTPPLICMSPAPMELETPQATA